jgi:SsrA-binding protein
MITNRDVKFNYHILETETAGIMLMGSEIKSLRLGKANLTEAFIWIDIENNSIYIKNMYIKNELNNAYSHEELRDRKLLMTKKQIFKWHKETSIKGITIIPVKGFFDSKNRFKLEVALGKGKKMYDKRNKIREQDLDREISKKFKTYGNTE